MSKSPKKIELVLEEIGNVLTHEQKLCLQRHFKQQLKQAFVHGIMSGANGNFENYYEQKYDTLIKPDDHFGI
jgi:hypothetical protein